MHRDSYPVPSWIGHGKLRWVWGLWEPLMFYRRSAHMAAYAPGNTEWTQAWYLRMHSEEILDKLAEMGVNCVSTHYYKGFGVEAEAEEMERAARYTELCHARGIRVLGYHQWATICYETFLDEVPHAERWVQRNADGGLLLYGTSTYWRWLGCQQHEEYVAYLAEVVTRCLAEAKMDGIEWDGTVYKCHCELCQQRFRDYLEAKYEGIDVLPLFGIPHFHHVRIPSTEGRRDPLLQELLAFRRDFMRQKLREWNQLIKSINPEAAQVTYLVDPAPAEPPDAIDIIVDENHDSPFVDGEVLTHRQRGFKHGAALDRVVLGTSWFRAPSRNTRAREGEGADRFGTEAEVAAFGTPVGGLRRPERAAEVKRDLAECAASGGHVVTATWALRAVGGDRAAFEQPDLHAALRQYLGFFRRNEGWFDTAGSLARVGILRSSKSLELDFFASYPCVAGMEQICLQHQIPFRVVFSFALQDISRLDVLVLAEQTCLSDAEVAAIVGFVEGGGGLVVTGRTGMFDERFRARRAHPLKELFGRPRVAYFPDTPERLGAPQRDHPPAYHHFELPSGAQAVADAIVSAAARPLPVRVSAGRCVGVDGYRVGSGHRVIHLLNYDNDTPAHNTAVALSAEAAGELLVHEAQWVSPDTSPEAQQAEGEQVGDGWRFELETLDTYTMLVIPEASSVNGEARVEAP